MLLLFAFTGLKAQEEQPADSLANEAQTIERENTTSEDTVGQTGPSSFTLDARGGEVTKPASDSLMAPQPQTTTIYHQGNPERKKRQNEIQTIAGNNVHHGGFGALTFTGTEFNSKSTMLLGFRGGWIINRAVALGFEGHGLIPSAEYPDIDSQRPVDARAVGGYGGMFIEPILFSNKVVHLTFPVSAGGGWVGYVVDWEDSQNFNDDDLIDGDTFWYIKPGASVEVNVARNFRIALGASYRFTEDLELTGTPEDGFDGWNYFLTLKFGRF